MHCQSKEFLKFLRLTCKMRRSYNTIVTINTKDKIN